MANHTELPTIAVVDPAVGDYAELLQAVAQQRAHVQLLASGAQAQVVARRQTIHAWIINLRLPDQPGLDLARALLRRSARARIFMVGDCYEAEQEMQTLALGVTKYLCKPIDIDGVLKAASRAVPANRPRTTLPFPIRRFAAEPGERVRRFPVLASDNFEEDEVPAILPWRRPTTPAA